MQFSYPRYLTSKRTVDDRALNGHVLGSLRRELANRAGRIRVLEVGAGIGTMVARLLEQQIMRNADYTCLDVSAELTAAARSWLGAWARDHRYAVEEALDTLRIYDATTDVTVRFITRDVTAFLAEPAGDTFDLLIANAFLDLVDVPRTLPRLFARIAPRGLFWFSINFDGETILLPELPEDVELLRIYHRSMDDRTNDGRRAGDSKTGRHLFQSLRDAGATVLDAGSSDWVVHAAGSAYHEDEEYFLECILNTIHAELEKHSVVSRQVLHEWTATRREQLVNRELVLIAHQLDFFGTFAASR